uniref:Uncharacterized protein n=1 Tax=Meloidogyne enterolobii TaxID=390850 RepID=A0A6V7VH78_MELEN|nr:unnamed protein product [Meloidogyne enterolobii]
MSKFFFVLVIVAIVFIHCCDANREGEKKKGRRTLNKLNSIPRSSYPGHADVEEPIKPDSDDEDIYADPPGQRTRMFLIKILIIINNFEFQFPPFILPQFP